jgi:GNAT superfamily N-acetyltransferase
MALDPRLATPADLPAIEAIVQAAYSPYINRIGRKPGPMLDDYAALINDFRVYVVDQDEIIQGMVVLIPNEDAMLLDNVAVAPSARGLGVGRRLIAYAEQFAEKAGYNSIKLYTNEAMTENVTHYAKIGYKETHRIEGKGLKRVYMKKILV